MSEPDLADLARVENRGQGYGDSAERPEMSVYTEGLALGLLKHCYEELGEPEFIEFYQSDTRVFIVPHQDKEGVLNPHPVYSTGRCVSFAWHEVDEKGRAPLRYDDERSVYYFDTDELEPPT